MITAGDVLLLAGSTDALSKLPKGKWIGGSIPYFMAENGGVFDETKIFVTKLPDSYTGATITGYTRDSLKNVYSDAPANGFSVIIVPAGSDTHYAFALESSTYPNFASRPLVGWVSGVAVASIGVEKPTVFLGDGAKPATEGAVVMHVRLPADKYADINIINNFATGPGDVIRFASAGFSAKEAIVNGITVKLAEYVKAKSIDTRLPLVADYGGSMVNTSFQSVDDETGDVRFFAPVFADIDYIVAGQLEQDYVTGFDNALKEIDVEDIFFSCNCILNYRYSNLENRRTGGVTGPITFGEVAYHLMNQTMVYLTISDL